MTAYWKFLFSAGLAIAANIVMLPAGAQTAGPAIYTDAQAQAGATVYQQSCAACHGQALEGTAAPALKGPAFKDMAAAQSLTADTFLTVIATTMPQSDPGALTPDQYNQVTAYILQQNGLVAGTIELTPTTPGLKDVSLK